MKLFQKGQSALEMTALLTFIIVVFFIFQKFIVRGFVGRWRATGDTWGHGRQYDPALTVNCQYVQVRDTSGVVTDQFWFDEQCYDTANCWDACYDATATPASCNACKKACATNRDVCNDTQIPSAI